MTGAGKIFLLIGSGNAMLSVILGAFAAHGLRERLDDQMLATFQTGAQYHFYHALGLLIIGVLLNQFPLSGFKLSGWLMLAGIVLFSGSLYVLAITGIRQLGMITPVGGVSFILAWLMLLVTVYRA